MKAPLCFLTLASLLLPPALCQVKEPQDYRTFLLYHTTYYGARSFDCNRDMSWRQPSSTSCIPSNSFILGDTTDKTSMDDVKKVCRGEGTAMGNNQFKSNAMFRLVKCRVKDRNAGPPCLYKPTYETGQIIIGCQRGDPVHFVDMA